MMPESGGTMAWLHKCTDDLQNPAATHNTTPTSAARAGPAQLTCSCYTQYNTHISCSCWPCTADLQLLHTIQHPHQLLVLAPHSWPDGGLDLCLSDSELPKPDTILWYQWEHLLGNLVVWQGLCKWHTPPLQG